MQEVTLVYEQAGSYGIELSGGERLAVTDAGPHATDLVLAGLATCSVRTFRSVLARMRLDVGGLCLRIEAERSDEAPRVLTDVRVTWEVRPGDAPLARVLRALDLTEKYCSVLQTLRKAVAIEIVRRVEGAPVSPA